MYDRLRQRVFQVLEDPTSAGIVSRTVQMFLIVIITLNVVAVILQTVESLGVPYKAWFSRFEVFSVIVFTIEYLLRLWVAPLGPRYAGAILGRIRYAITPLALVDLLAIVPFYLPRLIPLDLRFIRALRLMRLVRFMKIGRYSESVRTVGAVLWERKEQLAAALLVLAVLLILTSSLMFYVEHDAQPQAFSSIPASMWWAVSTLTTVGYGDIYPVTTLGRVLGSVIAVLGIGLFALPAGILGSGFVERLGGQRKAPRKCPHCGKEIE
jgi:voltage-gated potassium channel